MKKGSKLKKLLLKIDNLVVTLFQKYMQKAQMKTLEGLVSKYKDEITTESNELSGITQPKLRDVRSSFETTSKLTEQKLKKEQDEIKLMVKDKLNVDISYKGEGDLDNKKWNFYSNVMPLYLLKGEDF